MREIAVIGIGQTPIGELWDRGLRDLGAESLRAAAADAGIERPDALFVSNMLATRLSDQAHLGALLADYAGWRGIEATTVEAACASGGAAFQAALRAVASGMIEVAAVCGVEKMTEATTGTVTSALATASDADYEVSQGASFVALNALVMQRYMYEYNVPHEAFAGFSINAHCNAVNNPNAMYRKAITEQQYKRAPMISDPINLYDSSPICDGSASLILAPLEMARELGKPLIVIRASASATDSLSLADRRTLLGLDAIKLSADKAYAQARIKPQDIQVFEAHDAFSIMAALSLEGCGFAEAGKGTHLALDGAISPTGRIPISTMGGLKGRGHPVGATGAYELVDLVTQLRGEAGTNQVQGATLGMAQNIGGTAATVVTHILERIG
ncbi:MAG TPA: thiolase domain-containing protein [Aggregatilineales bacterium]|nr:thiolase domain-containing protein [Aggregatilineales bacterium]